MSDKLLPCPFCGLDPDEVYRPFGQDYYISCSPCSGSGSVEVIALTKGEAIAAWNRRAPSPLPRRNPMRYDSTEVTKLRGMITTLRNEKKELEAALERARGFLKEIRVKERKHSYGGMPCDCYYCDLSRRYVASLAPQPSPAPVESKPKCGCQRHEENGHYRTDCPHYKGACVAHGKSNCGTCDFDKDAKWSTPAADTAKPSPEGSK